jgi:type II secretory pathway component PulF
VPNPTLDALANEVTQDVDVMSSAQKTIDGIQGRLDDAVKKALANGATAQELAPVTDEIAGLKAARDKLAASIAANTPAAGTTTSAPSHAGAPRQARGGPRQP